MAQEFSSAFFQYENPVQTRSEMKLTYSLSELDDAETLVAIRIAAMRESLEHLGRFDPQRARVRFLNSFDPAQCRFIAADGARVGFIVVRPEQDHWLLDHFYIESEFQRRGIGAAVLRDMFAQADAQHMPVRVGALRGSASNRFYQRHGFVQIDETEWDIYYIRQPRQAEK